jgi:hypothetical protein
MCIVFIPLTHEVAPVVRQPGTIGGESDNDICEDGEERFEILETFAPDDFSGKLGDNA